VAEVSPQQVADGVHRLGSRLVNWYLVEDGGRLTVVDCGAAGYFDQVESGVSAIGHSMDDLAAIVLTHGDGDHVGFAERLRADAGIPVLIHELDVPLATTTKLKKTEGGMVRYLRYPAAWGLLAHLGANGGLRPPPVAAVTPYGEDQTLDVPGQPRVVFTPGHSDGHCALHFERHGVVFAGDSLCTRNPLTGRAGAQLMPSAFNASTERAIESLDALEATGAETVLAGHGEPWTDGAAKAAQAAREFGPT
jgi:glyoxylase-like metal-dependent hydrolase (beta-lactamase superfamily II)